MIQPLSHLLAEDLGDGIIHGASILSGTPERLLYRSSVGYADAAHRFPMTSDTILDIASVTKVVATVTALLILHHRQRIDFDAPFTRYLNDFKARLFPAIPTIRDLANHTSGFEDVPGQPQRLYFAESGTQMLANMLTTPPPYPPNRPPSYACWNYILLALIVERITGTAFDTFCQDAIFQPLQMADTTLGKPRQLAAHRLAQTMGTDRPGMISDCIAQRIYRDGGCTGNAGCFSTANDLAKLLACYLRHGTTTDGSTLFGEQEFQEIAPDTRSHALGYRRFGWAIYEDYLPEALYGKALFHSGWSGQSVLMNVETQQFIVVLTTRCGDYERAKAHRFQIIKVLSGLD